MAKIYVNPELKNALNYCGAPSEWVDACIKYYEDNWRF